MRRHFLREPTRSNPPVHTCTHAVGLAAGRTRQLGSETPELPGNKGWLSPTCHRIRVQRTRRPCFQACCLVLRGLAAARTHRFHHSRRAPSTRTACRLRRSIHTDVRPGSFVGRALAAIAKRDIRPASSVSRETSHTWPTCLVQQPARSSPYVGEGGERATVPQLASSGAKDGPALTLTDLTAVPQGANIAATMTRDYRSAG